jgi:hypothetical protein
MLAQHKALVTPCVIIVAFILGSFPSDEARKGASGRGGRAMLVKMGDKVGTNRSMGETMLSV